MFFFLKFNSGTHGGGIYTAATFNHSIVAFNCSISNNLATYTGGGISISESSIVTFIQTSCDNNVAEKGNGGCANLLDSGTGNFFYSSFKNNSAGRNGGAICGNDISKINSSLCTIE